MILITKKYRLNSIPSDSIITVLIPDCATLISQLYDKTTGILTVVIEYCNQECLNNYNTIKIIVVDNKGNCTYEKEFTINNVCIDFDFDNPDGIVSIDECDSICCLALTAKTNDNTATYEWEYDTNLFTEKVKQGTKLVLSYKNSAKLHNNTNTSIRVKVTNKEKCILYADYVHNICIPTLTTKELNAICLGTNHTTGYFNLNDVLNTCGDYTLDINTIINLGEYVTVDTNTGAGFNLGKGPKGSNQLELFLSGFQNIQVETLMEVPYDVQLCDGLIITGLLRLTLLPCLGDNFTKPYEYTFDCEQCTDKLNKGSKTQGLVLKGITASNNNCPAPVVDLKDYIVSNSSINWSSFTFVPTTPPQTLLSALELNTPFASVVFNINNQSVTYNSTGGLSTLEIVLFQVENINREVINGKLTFKKDTCDDDAIEINDITLCLPKGSKAHRVVLGPTDSIVEIVQFFTNTLVSIDRNIGYITPNEDLIGEDIFKYRVKARGIDSNVATIKLQIAGAFVNNLSVCLNEIGKVNVNLNDYNNEEVDQTNSWHFNGYTTDINLINEGGIGTFSVNNGEFKNYEKLEKVSFNSNATITFQVSGIYSFRTMSLDDCSKQIEVNIEVINPLSLPLNNAKALCINTGVVKLTSLLEVELPSGGLWENIGTPTASFDVTNNTINTLSELPGNYLFKYTTPNKGLFNDVACTSQLLLAVQIDGLPDEILPKCFVSCTLGPDPVIEPNCQNISIDVDIDTPLNCFVELFTLFGLVQGRDRIKLKSAPLNPIILDINGMSNTYRPNDLIGNIKAIWNYYKAPIGKYEFTGIYGNACERVVEFDITLRKGACVYTNRTIKECATPNGTLQLFQELSNSTCIVNTINQIMGTNTTSYNSATGVMSLNAPGIWEFEYGTNLETDFDSCEVCSSLATLRIEISPLPGPGEANPGTVCKGACDVNLYTLFFVNNNSTMGLLQYSGYSLGYLPLPVICSIPLSLTNGPLINTAFVASTGPYNAGQQMPTEFALTETTTPGYYYFTNTVTDSNGCTCTSQTVIQVVTAQSAGTGSTLVVCDNDDQILVLRDLITDEDGNGAWSVVFTPINPGENYTTALNQGSPGFWVGGDQATFNTANQPVGNYVFKYTTTTPPATFNYYTDCPDCGLAQSTVELDLINSQTAGTGNSPATCQ